MDDWLRHNFHRLRQNPLWPPHDDGDFPQNQCVAAGRARPRRRAGAAVRTDFDDAFVSGQEAGPCHSGAQRPWRGSRGKDPSRRDDDVLPRRSGPRRRGKRHEQFPTKYHAKCFTVLLVADRAVMTGPGARRDLAGEHDRPGLGRRRAARRGHRKGAGNNSADGHRPEGYRTPHLNLLVSSLPVPVAFVATAMAGGVKALE
jgi:hypothetical protein